MEEVDKKIIQCLKEEGTCNQARLSCYTFSREGQGVFRRRLINLEEKRVINIKKTKHEWRIGLTERFINSLLYKCITTENGK